jgi:hypothetical protein
MRATGRLARAPASDRSSGSRPRERPVVRERGRSMRAARGDPPVADVRSSATFGGAGVRKSATSGGPRRGSGAPTPPARTVHRGGRSESEGLGRRNRTWRRTAVPRGVLASRGVLRSQAAEGGPWARPAPGRHSFGGGFKTSIFGAFRPCRGASKQLAFDLDSAQRLVMNARPLRAGRHGASPRRSGGRRKRTPLRRRSKSSRYQVGRVS